MLLINCTTHLELNWIEDYFINDRNFANFEITLSYMFQYLSTKDNVNLAKQLSDGFKRSVYWNSYQTFPAKVINNEDNIYELLSASFQGIKRLFAFA